MSLRKLAYLSIMLQLAWRMSLLTVELNRDPAVFRASFLRKLAAGAMAAAAILGSRQRPCPPPFFGGMLRLLACHEQRMQAK